MVDDTKIDKVFEKYKQGNLTQQEYDQLSEEEKLAFQQKDASLSDEEKKQIQKKSEDKQQERQKKEKERQEQLKLNRQKKIDETVDKIVQEYKDILESHGFTKKEIANEDLKKYAKKIIDESENLLRENKNFFEQVIKELERRDKLSAKSDQREQQIAIFNNPDIIAQMGRTVIEQKNLMDTQQKVSATKEKLGLISSGLAQNLPMHMLEPTDTTKLNPKDFHEQSLTAQRIAAMYDTPNFRSVDEPPISVDKLPKDYKTLEKKLQKIVDKTQKNAKAKDSDIAKSIDQAINEYAFWHGEEVHDQQIARGLPVALQYRTMRSFRSALKGHLDDVVKKYDLKKSNFHKQNDIEDKVTDLIGKIVGEALYHHFMLQGNKKLAKMYQKRFNEDFTEDDVQAGLDIVGGEVGRRERSFDFKSIKQLKYLIADELSGKKEDLYLPGNQDLKSGRAKTPEYRSVIRQLQDFVVHPVAQYQIELEQRLITYLNEPEAVERMREYNIDKMPKPAQGKIEFKAMEDTYASHLENHKLGRRIGFDSEVFYQQIKHKLDVKDKKYEEQFSADTAAGD